MIFKNYPSPSAVVKYQMMRKIGSSSTHSSLESVKGGLLARRRSLSLDDLGTPMPPYDYVAEEETDDEEIDELPEDCTSTLELLKPLSTDAGEATNSLSTLREASSPITAEEWSPSPIDGMDAAADAPGIGKEHKENAQKSLDISDGDAVSSNKTKSIVHSVLAKWRTKIKK